ncbi:serine/threonine-protein kinase [Nostocoides sp. HKS02]|uniref:serine/threonine-protein kinase n=1 Tax=Nostocoides sp. HKS02 TaxID=1813880 RepID=UPI0018A858EC|nr:serine/threonine-protein kinase [Tetrasphaera sp. HKS02]
MARDRRAAGPARGDQGAPRRPPGGTARAGGTAGAEEFRERFRHEARNSAALSHPNIATVFDFGDDAARPYLVMELVEGRSLAQVVAERGALPAEEVSSILGQAALALQVAHNAGVVHRDVKPANIMVTPAGMVKLTDFGIARATASSGLTRTGEVLGTPHYLAPEQAQGHPATAASDVYALGVVGHELLTGVRPFSGESIVATALAHVSQPPPELPQTVPEPLRAAIMAALAKDPADRPASAGELAARLGMPVGPLTPVPGADSGVAETTALVATPAPTAVLAAGLGASATTAETAPATTAETAPATGSSADPERRRRPWWLVPLGAAVAVVAIVVAAVSLSGGSPTTPSTRSATTPVSAHSTPPTTRPTGPTTTTATTTAPRAPVAPKPAAHAGKGKGGKKK